MLPPVLPPPSLTSSSHPGHPGLTSPLHPLNFPPLIGPSSSPLPQFPTFSVPAPLPLPSSVSTLPLPSSASTILADPSSVPLPVLPSVPPASPSAPSLAPPAHSASLSALSVPLPGSPVQLPATSLPGLPQQPSLPTSLPLVATHPFSSFPNPLAPNSSLPPRPTFANLFDTPNLFLSHTPCFPSTLPSSWKNGKPSITIPQAMIASSRESFHNAVIGRFVGRRPSLEWVEERSKLWSLSRPCLVSLTSKGFFLFRFNSPEDKASVLALSPLPMGKHKLFLLPWSPGQEETDWPSIAPVWIRLKGLPYHCWSQNIILSLANSIGPPIKLDHITMGQKILSFARVQVNLDLSKPKPASILVDLQGERELEIEVVYESLPCTHCLSAGHNPQSCPSIQVCRPIHTPPGSPPQAPQPPQPPLLLVPPQAPVIPLIPSLNSAPSPPPPAAPTQFPSSQPLSNPSSLTNQISFTPNPSITASSTSFSSLPFEVVTEILQRTPSPSIDTSNAFSILDNCSIVDPALNPSTSGSNLQAHLGNSPSSPLDPPPGFDHPLQSPVGQLPILSPLPPELSNPVSPATSSPPPATTLALPTSVSLPATVASKPPTSNLGRGKGKGPKGSSSGPITRRNKGKTPPLPNLPSC